MELKLPFLAKELSDIGGVKWGESTVVTRVLRPSMVDRRPQRPARFAPAQLEMNDLLIPDGHGIPAVHFLSKVVSDCLAPVPLGGLVARVLEVPRTVEGCLQAIRAAT